ATSIDEHAAHGSDSVASAAREMASFFPSEEIFQRTR
ncbi:nucleoside-diphosphate kinase, partial [Acinetobacter ursingii]